jgi:hypothetical protein
MQDTGLLSHILPEIARLVGYIAILTPPPHDVAARHMTAGEAVWQHTLRRLDAIQQHAVVTHRRHLDLLLAALFQDSGCPDATPAACAASGQSERVAQVSAALAAQRLEALKMTTIGVRLEVVKGLISASATPGTRLRTAPALRHFVHRYGTETTFLLLDLWLADRIATLPPQATDDLLLLRQRLQEELARHIPLSLKDLAVNGHDLQHLGIPPGPQMGRILQALLQRVLDEPACNTRAYLLSVVQNEWAPRVSATQRQPPEAPA